MIDPATIPARGTGEQRPLYEGAKPCQRIVNPIEGFSLYVAHPGPAGARFFAVEFRSAGISGFWSPMDSTGVLKSDLPALFPRVTARRRESHGLRRWSEVMRPAPRSEPAVR
jgi:hypothetical protein